MSAKNEIKVKYSELLHNQLEILKFTHRIEGNKLVITITNKWHLHLLHSGQWSLDDYAKKVLSV